MIETTARRAALPSSAGRRVGLVTTYPPTRCGIARFSASLVTALGTVAPALDIEVVRLLPPPAPAPPSIGTVAAVVDPESAVSRRTAARRLNECEAMILQHEYGIFGANDGEGVLDLVEMVHCPKVAVLHTVLPRPSPAQRRIISALERSCTLVVPSQSARRTLESSYGIEAGAVTVIPHGANWTPMPTNPPPHRMLVTWGLLGPGKGLERAIRAVAMLRDVDPPIEYLIVGGTHPAVFARTGCSYRQSLETLVRDLDVEDRVRFVDRYVDDLELLDLVSRSDLVVVPYDNQEQVSSGVLTEAVAVGRPVVATEFPHAVELLAGGAGVTVDHDPTALAAAVDTVLRDEDLYVEMSRAAARKSTLLSWTSVAERFTEVLDGALAERASA